jgi:hypothetical protein
MQPDGSLPKSGSGPQRSYGGGIRLGADRGVTPGQAGSAPGPAATDQSRAGYSLESGRRAANLLQEAQAKAKQPTVRPPLLIALIAAFVMLIAVVIARSGAKPHFGYDHERLLSRYSDFLKANPHLALPDVETVKRELNGIAYLEDTGRTDEARQAWMSLLTTNRDPKAEADCLAANRQNCVNPLYEEAVDRLHR